jgi:hypothetical protein
MTKVKVELEKGQTPDEAEELLFKALDAKLSGSTSEEFNDPAMTHILSRMDEIYKKNHDAMVNEIIQALEEDYSNGDL